MTETPTDSQIRSILTRARTIAVVGLSPNTARPSYRVAAFLQARGHRIIPVNPGQAGGMLLGETVYPDLAAIPAGTAVDMVDIFRRSEDAGAVIDAAVEKLGPRGLSAIWTQLGVIDEAAAARARARGVEVVMNRCPAIEIPRLGLPPLA